MNPVRSNRGWMEAATLAIVMMFVMADWTDAGIARVAANQTPPSGAEPQVDAAPDKDSDRIAAQALSDQDKRFLQQALQGGTAEMQEARLAQEKAASKDVKDAAAHLERDHTKTIGELKRIASTSGVSVIVESPADRQQLYERLRGLSGKQFDDEYVRAGIDAHRRTIDLFERTEAKTQNPAIKTFASSTLPTLKMHLEMMQAIDGG